MKKIQISSIKKGIIGVVGHAGIAHAHGANNYQQDDSAGFCTAGSMVAKALDVDTSVDKVTCTAESVTVSLKSGGRSTAYPRRGVTPFEAEMMKKAAGKDALFSQTLASKIFGRIYGQGVMETAACFQGALSLAVLDSFKKASPENVNIVHEGADRAGAILGTVVEYENIPVSVVIPVNFSPGGIGPDEDFEGSYMLGQKGEMMKKIGFPMPAIVAESKVSSVLSDGIDRESFLIRVSRERGNLVVAKALEKACSKLNLPYIYRDDLLSYDADTLQKATDVFADKLDKIARTIRTAETASEKIRLSAELAILVSQDAGGFTYMSKAIFSKAASPGLEPNTSAVLSMVTGKEYIKKNIIPFVTEEDRENYVKVILKTIKYLSNTV